MYGAGDQFLTGTGFARYQHRGVRGGNLDDTRNYGFQGRRGAHNFFKQEGLIDLLPQRQVLVMNLLLYLLPILDIGRCDIPAGDASLSIEHRIKAGEKPAILPVSSLEPRFDLVRGCAREFGRLLTPQAFGVLRMHQALQVSGLPLLKRHAVIIERGLIVVQATSISPEFGDVQRCEIKELSELFFALPDLLLGALALMDVLSGGIPARELSVLVAQRVMANQNPAVLTVLP